jgi:DNA polymerase III delta prime subunit
MRINPYTPISGMFPTYLAGREAMLDEAKEDLTNLQRNFPQQSVIYYGLRGVGKTVLLSLIMELACNNDILTDYINIAENGGFKNRMSLCAQKFIVSMSPIVKDQVLAVKALSTLKAFQFTYGANNGNPVQANPNIETFNKISGIGDFENDLTDLFLAMGTLAREHGKSICVFVDEMQCLKTDELGALLAALFQAYQKHLPIILFGAGLPQTINTFTKIPSHSESLFAFREIGSLSDTDAKLALIKPAENEGVAYTDEALERILEITGNYPYFIQEFATQAWKHIENDTIDLKAAESAIPDFEAALDSGFFTVRFDKASNKQKLFMFAMLDCGGLPCTISQVAANMHTESQRVYPLRAELISKGLICSSQYSKIDFAVPQFDKFLQRNANLKSCL